jgi:hypothetical protein
MLRALVRNAPRQRDNGPGHDAGAGRPSPSELNSGMHALLLPLLLDAVEGLPACSAPQVGVEGMKRGDEKGGGLYSLWEWELGLSINSPLSLSLSSPLHIHKHKHKHAQNAAIDLLAEVGAVHMPVPHLRRLLRLLQPTTHTHHPNNGNNARRPANLSKLLRCLDRMVGEDRSPGPSHYWWLDGGPQSGMRLRPLLGFSRRHYTFVTWVRLEGEGAASFSSSSSPSSSSSSSSPSVPYRPHLFSFVAEDGTALDAYFLPAGGGSGRGGDGRCFALQVEYRRNKVLYFVLSHCRLWAFVSCFMEEEERALHVDTFGCFHRHPPPPPTHTHRRRRPWWSGRRRGQRRQAAATTAPGLWRVAGES